MAGRQVDTARLTAAVENTHPPAVTIHLPGQRTHGVLLCWGRHPSAGWVGGVAMLLTRGNRRVALRISSGPVME